MIRALTTAVAVACLCATARCGEIEAVLSQVRRACENPRVYPDETTAERNEEGWRVTGLVIDVIRTDLADADLKRISELTSLERLEFWGSPFSTDSCWRRLGHLPRLRHLGLGKGAREQTLTSLAALNSLEGLNMRMSYGDYPGDAAVARLRDFAHLKSLTLADWATDATLDHVQGLSGLENLSLIRSRNIGEAAVCDLEKLTNLRSLEVYELSPKGVAALSALPRLESLTFECWSPDGGVVDLSALSGLKSLTLGDMREVVGNIHKSLKGEGVVVRARLPLGLQRLQIGRGGCYTLLAEVLELVDPLPPNIESISIAFYGDFPSTTGRTTVPDRLGMFLKLNEVKLADIPYEDVAARLGSIPRLRSLELLQSPCGGVTWNAEGIAGLATLQGLQSLVIEDVSAMNDDAIYLGRAQIDALTRLKNLRRFELLGSPTVTLDALEAVPKLKCLEVLALCLPQETPDGSVAKGLAGLGSLVHMRELTLEGHVTDAGLAALAQLKGLRRLALCGERETDGYTDGGLAALVKSLPELKVVKWQGLPSADWDASEFAAPAVREPPPPPLLQPPTPEKKLEPVAAPSPAEVAPSSPWALAAGVEAAVTALAVAVCVAAVFLIRRRRAANRM